MPRRERCIVTGVPHHVTQRGVDRCAVFETDFDRRTYLRLLSEQRDQARVRVARALAYADNNPVRARMVAVATEYPWSSAGAHAGGADASGLLDSGWQRAAEIGAEWIGYLAEAVGDAELEKCTYAGRPFGDVDFVTRVGEYFGRRWRRGRPKKKAEHEAGPANLSGSLFVD